MNGIPINGSFEEYREAMVGGALALERRMDEVATFVIDLFSFLSFLFSFLIFDVTSPLLLFKTLAFSMFYSCIFTSCFEKCR